MLQKNRIKRKIRFHSTVQAVGSPHFFLGLPTNKKCWFVFQGFTNLGYDDDKYSDYSDPSQTRPPNGQSWNPEDSKDTYAKITEQLDQEKRFEVDFNICY